MIDKPTALFVSTCIPEKYIDTIRDDYKIIFLKSTEPLFDKLEENDAKIIIFYHQNERTLTDFLKMREISKFKFVPSLIISPKLSLNERDILSKFSFVDFLDGEINGSIFKSKVKFITTYLNNNDGYKYLYLYEHDSITDLYNNHGLFSKSADFIKSQKSEKMCLITIEIGKFNLYYTYNGLNKSLTLIRFLSMKIQSSFKNVGNCLVFRFNPNIFQVIIPYDEHKIESTLEEIKNSVSNYDENYFLLPKACINIFDIDEYKLDDILNLNALTLDRFHATHNNFIVYYSEELKRNAILEQELISEMQRGIKNREFQIYIQPKFISKLGRPYGGEALVRWIHPTKGLINPGSFIPLFEANGSIAKIDLYVWEEVCKQLRKWIDQGKNPDPISVNMSRLDAYNVDVVEKLISLVDKYNIPIDLLHIEVTESAYIRDFQALISTVKRLKSFGFKIYVDDFGAGYTSLCTLNKASIDVIKLDQSLLVNNDDRGKCIITELIQLAKALKIKTVMEGVEDSKQAHFFKEIGCDYIQGYYYAKPMPVNEYEKLVENFE